MAEDTHTRAAYDPADPLPESLPRFNWGAFLVPPIWGVAYGLWAGVFFLPAWAFVDNVIRGPEAFGGMSPALGWVMAAATLALQLAYAFTANRIVWHRSRGTLDIDRYLRHQRWWTIAGAVTVVVMGVWIALFIAGGGAPITQSSDTGGGICGADRYYAESGYRG